MNKRYEKVPYEAPMIDWVACQVEEGFALSSGNPEDWKDSGKNWEQDE